MVINEQFKFFKDTNYSTSSKISQWLRTINLDAVLCAPVKLHKINDYLKMYDLRDIKFNSMFNVGWGIKLLW